MTETPQHAGVVIPPPLVLLGVIILGVLLAVFAPLGVFAHLPVFVRAAIGGGFIAGGVLLAMQAWQLFKRDNTDVRPWKPSSSLVADGIYEKMRNPMYVGMVLFVIGLGFMTASEWMVLLAIPFALYLHFYVVMREEAYLSATFGEPYREYMNRVKRYGAF